MAKLIWGIDPLAVSRMGRTAKKPPFTKKELARIGIPAHKIPRVQEELARLTADKTLTREELGRLAEEISWLCCELAFPLGGRWPRPRPRPDEGEVAAIAP